MSSHLSDIISALMDRDYLLTLHIWENFATEYNRPPPSSIISSVRNDKPEILENYPNDPRGACCLILSESTNGKKIHSVVTYGERPVRIITAYYPSPDIWSNDRERRSK